MFVSISESKNNCRFLLVVLLSNVLYWGLKYENNVHQGELTNTQKLLKLCFIILIQHTVNLLLSEIAQSYAQAVHFNTYGGNPVSSAVGKAVLEVNICVTVCVVKREERDKEDVKCIFRSNCLSQI